MEGNPISYLDPFGSEPWDTTEMHLAATALGLAASKLPQPLSSCVSAVAAGFDLGLTLYDIFYQLKNYETTSILISIGTIILDITTIVTSIIMIDKVSEIIILAKQRFINNGYADSLSRIACKCSDIGRILTKVSFSTLLYSIYDNIEKLNEDIKYIFHQLTS